VRIVRPNGVHLDISSASGHETLVDVRAIATDSVDVSIELRRLVALLSEEHLRTATHRMRIIDVHVMILSRHGFLNERLGHLPAINVHLLIVLLELAQLAIVLITINDSMRWHRKSVLLQRSVHLAAVKQGVLPPQRVNNERLRHLCVLRRLCQRKSIREKRYQRVNMGPLLDRGV